MANKTRAERFIDAYNNISYVLRVRYNFNRSMGFSELIRRSVALNYVVRKYENELVDYGRLRNAIIHDSSDGKIIADPRKEVVDNIEKINRLLDTPPKALDTVARRDILAVESNSSMRDVIELIASSHYSNLPVYQNKSLLGIANGQKILDAFGMFLKTGGQADVFLDNVKIEDMLSKIQNSDYYIVANASLTVEEALGLFHKFPKLLAILITSSGNEKEMPLGIITGADVVEMNKILENY